VTELCEGIFESERGQRKGLERRVVKSRTEGGGRDVKVGNDEGIHSLRPSIIITGRYNYHRYILCRKVRDVFSKEEANGTIVAAGVVESVIVTVRTSDGDNHLKKKIAAGK